MKQSNQVCACVLAISAFALSGCTENYIAQSAKEDYVQAYLQSFGEPVAGHTYNTAVRNKITIKSKSPVTVKVLADINGKYYQFAEWAVDGTSEIKFDAPSHVQDFMICAEDQMIPAKAGSVIDIDNPAKVRSREDVWEPNGDKTDPKNVVLGTREVLGNGFVKVDTMAYAGRQLWGDAGCYTSFQLGSEMRKYVSPDAATYASYETFSDGYSHFSYPWFNMHVLNVNLPNPDHEYEIGVVFGNTNALNTSTQLTYIPVYNSKTAQGTRTGGYYVDTRGEYPFVKAGAQITIDFSKNGGDGSTTFRHTDVFKPNDDTFKDIAKDNIANYGNNSLEAKLKAHAAVQGNIPDIAWLSQHGATSGEVTLLPIDDSDPNYDPWTFYDVYDNYIEAWLNDPEHSATKDALPADHYMTLREVFCHLRMYIPDNAYPIVKEVAPQKYSITYYTAWLMDVQNLKENVYEDIPDVGRSWKIEDDKYYACTLAQVRVPDWNTTNQHPFAIYMWDKDANKIITTANVHGKRTNWAPTTKEGNVQLGSGYSVNMIDFDGDGIYNDFVYIWSHPGGYSKGPQFEPYTWLLACEDLGSTCDWDFNDAVVKVKYMATNSMTEQNIEITPMAAGGIYPIYLMYSDPITSKSYLVGEEIHKWLGASIGEDGIYPFVNTEHPKYNKDTDKISASKYVWNIPLHENLDFSMAEFQNNFSWKIDNNTLAGFWLLVDKENKMSTVLNNPDRNSFQEINYRDLTFYIAGDLWQVNNAPIPGTNSSIPMLICVGQDWEWPTETSNIWDAYGSWFTWIKSSDPTKVTWYGTAASDRNRNKVVQRWEE